MADGVRKGPADAAIRQVSEAEAEAAWGDGGGPEATLADRNAGRALPTKGIRLVSPGGKDVETAPDSRAAANLAARRARQTAVQPPVAVPPTAPEPPPMEDWELQVQQEIARSAPEPVPGPSSQIAQEGSGANPLLRATKVALRLLDGLPPGFALAVGAVSGTSGIELVMGLGVLVGKGWALFNGVSYEITNSGHSAYLEGKSE